MLKLTLLDVKMYNKVNNYRCQAVKMRLVLACP